MKNVHTYTHIHKWQEKKLLLKLLRDHGDIVQYITGLTDRMTLAAISSFVSTHLPFDKWHALSPF